ncbi:MAG TPA: hypothetical protein VN650_16590 [Gemmatimonadaceae bacterium]|nr:hypothetical protein [Gemmatimonadaceae bacterium]
MSATLVSPSWAAMSLTCTTPVTRWAEAKAAHMGSIKSATALSKLHLQQPFIDEHHSVEVANEMYDQVAEEN